MNDRHRSTFSTAAARPRARPVPGRRLPGALPLAFATDRPERPLPMRLHCGGADIDVAGLPAGTGGRRRRL